VPTFAVVIALAEHMHGVLAFIVNIRCQRFASVILCYSKDVISRRSSEQVPPRVWPSGEA